MESAERFERLVQLILKWNKRINITGLKRYSDIKRELIEDSLKPLEFNLVVSPVLDAGCGAGFPTLPLAMESSELEIVAVDSNRKKINFLRYAVRELGLKNVRPVLGRLEEQKNLRGAFATVLSKAFMPPQEAMLFLKPFLRSDGRLIIYTVERVVEEGIEEKALSLYGDCQVFPYTLSDGTCRALLVLSKPL